MSNMSLEEKPQQDLRSSESEKMCVTSESDSIENMDSSTLPSDLSSNEKVVSKTHSSFHSVSSLEKHNLSSTTPSDSDVQAGGKSGSSVSHDSAALETSSGSDANPPICNPDHVSDNDSKNLAMDEAVPESGDQPQPSSSDARISGAITSVGAPTSNSSGSGTELVCDSVSLAGGHTGHSSSAQSSPSSLKDGKEEVVLSPCLPHRTQLECCYEFEKDNFVDGKGPTLVCTLCEKEGHLKNACPDDELPEILPLAGITNYHHKILEDTLREIPSRVRLNETSLQGRFDFIKRLEHFIRYQFLDAQLRLFGSSCNGFGFDCSDMDICMTFQTRSAEQVNKVNVIESLAHMLKQFNELKSVQAITTAKVPIVKFMLTYTGLEGDISLYNTLAQQNTHLLLCYSKIDPRVSTLGYTIKAFAKVCDIGDASRGSLSSYAYILMMIYYLQQVKPPVIPVLQELYTGDKKPTYMIEGCDAWFMDDLDKLNKLWPEKGKNRMFVAELWLGFFRFYVEEFNYKEFVVCIRQKALLTRFEKLWNGSSIAIEDPFDISHNLGSALTRTMNNFIFKTFINGRMLYGSSIDDYMEMFNKYRRPWDYFFSNELLSESRPPNVRGCRRCGKIGHMVRHCPLNRKDAAEEEHKQQQQHSQQKPKPRPKQSFTPNPSPSMHLKWKPQQQQHPQGQGQHNPKADPHPKQQQQSHPQLPRYALMQGYNMKQQQQRSQSYMYEQSMKHQSQQQHRGEQDRRDNDSKKFQNSNNHNMAHQETFNPYNCHTGNVAIAPVPAVTSLTRLSGIYQAVPVLAYNLNSNPRMQRAYPNMLPNSQSQPQPPPPQLKSMLLGHFPLNQGQTPTSAGSHKLPPSLAMSNQRGAMANAFYQPLMTGPPGNVTYPVVSPPSPHLHKESSRAGMPNYAVFDAGSANGQQKK